MKEEYKEEEMSILGIFQSICQWYETFFFPECKTGKENEPKVMNNRKKKKFVEGKQGQ